MAKVALITGITGQDGSFLSELLFSKGYKIHGLIRRSSTPNTSRINHILDKITLWRGDITDLSCVINIIKEINPIEIYHLAAQSFVKDSFDFPTYTAHVDALGTLNILEAVRLVNPLCKVYQASTSELYGLVQEKPQTETTPFYPRSPYAVAKLYAYWIIKNYREAYDIFAINGILFNHESSRRGHEFVTKKITNAIQKGETLKLGNLNSQRDWGHAKDYVEGMWLMLQQDIPQDYVLATGECHSVREFVEEAYKVVGKTIKWEGEGINEVGKIDDDIVVTIDPQFYRPAEVDFLLGNPAKAKRELNWEPKTTFKELVEEMVLVR